MDLNRLFFGRSRWFGLLGALAACSDGGGTSAPEPCTGDACLDASPAPMANRDAGPPPRRAIQLDASHTEELRAQIQVNGATTACGSCSVLIAQVQGGTLPYEYRWSDPTLQGPGPHQVCPDEPKTYSVVVTDSSESGSGEFYKPNQVVEAVGETRCVASDAGIAGFQGCTTSQPAADAGAADSGVQTTCGDAGVSFDFLTGAVGTVTVSTHLGDKGFKAGQAYEYSHDRLIPITLSLGEAVMVNVYGANEHCGMGEKLFTLTYDLLTWHQSSCFTPSKDYDYLIVEVHLNGAIFSWEFLASGTTCTGCGTQSP